MLSPDSGHIWDASVGPGEQQVLAIKVNCNYSSCNNSKHGEKVLYDDAHNIKQCLTEGKRIEIVDGIY